MRSFAAMQKSTKSNGGADGDNARVTGASFDRSRSLNAATIEGCTRGGAKAHCSRVRIKSTTTLSSSSAEYVNTRPPAPTLKLVPSSADVTVPLA